MYIAMNRFKIVKGKETEFENIWKNRDSHIEGVEGFKEFNLIKGNIEDSFTLYASHSVWESENDFLNWTKSEKFRLAHKGAGNHSEIYIGHPVFEGFKVVV
jgi:heme-degrading monooxygenase HmoA